MEYERSRAKIQGAPSERREVITYREVPQRNDGIARAEIVSDAKGNSCPCHHQRFSCGGFYGMARRYPAATFAHRVEIRSGLLGNLFPGSERVSVGRCQARRHEAKIRSESDRRLHLCEPCCLRNYDVGIDGPGS